STRDATSPPNPTPRRHHPPSPRLRRVHRLGSLPPAAPPPPPSSLRGADAKLGHSRQVRPRPRAMGPAPRTGGEPMKQRVNRCLHRLSDRDTEAMAANELDAIARGLDADELPVFLAAVSDTRATDKAPLRRHSLRLLALLVAAHPRDAVAPLVPRLVAAALRRVRDPDSSVRAALVDAARAIAGAAAPPSAPAALGPLADAVLHEQDQCAQLAAALAAAAAVEASAPTADLADYLLALLPRLLKLLRSAAFKAKPALISLIGAASAATDSEGAATAVPCLRDALGGDDWAARKAAAEALALLALEHGDDLAAHKPSCIAVFEAKRFDKVGPSSTIVEIFCSWICFLLVDISRLFLAMQVKIVRESMNRMIEAWKEIPDAEEDVCSSAASPAQTRSPSLAGDVTSVLLEILSKLFSIVWTLD
uniref:TORTIFOLIA1/SINE1-2 N-terminal domain-containing protein n=1 Tax=Aegilops tauschii subsp. strangulata TaxID=200361 RepID=A0A453R8V7_AEGTS